MKIGILGCGWLGLPLAKKLIENGHSVKGTTTGREKMNVLANAGITPFQIKLFESGVQGDPSSFLNEVEVLIINIPPGLRSNPEENFIEKMGRFKKHIEKSSVRHVLFVSSTAVFKDEVNFPEYNEGNQPNGTAQNAIQLYAVEQLLKASDAFTTCVVRFGGLYGPGRHPVTFLAGKNDLKNPAAPVNLIHIEDCIGIFTAVLEKKLWEDTFHGVHPMHPSKKDYYTAIAFQKNLATLQFNTIDVSRGKVINSINLKEKLQYTFSKNLEEN